MSDADDADIERFRFPPLDRAGLLLGLPAGPLVTVAAGLVAAVVALAAVPGVAGPAAAVVIAVAAAVAGCWPLAGEPPVRWAPVTLRWLARRRAMPLLDPAPHAGAPLAFPGAERTASHVPDRVAGPDTSAGRRRPPDTSAGRRPPGTSHGQDRSGRGAGRSARAGGAWRPDGQVRRSSAPAGLRIRPVPALPGEPPLGVVDDLRDGWSAAVVPVHGPGLGLLAPAAQAQQVARWGGVMAALSRDGSSIRRLQWIQRCSPGDPAPLHACAAAAPGPEAARRSYGRLIAAEGASIAEHRTLLVIGVGAARAFPGRRPPVATDELLRRELRLVHGQLRSAGLTPATPLDHRALVAEIASAGDPTVPRDRALPASPWPSAVDEGWGAVRVDGTWQSTYWVAEWPRLPVGPDVLAPLLRAGSARTLAVCLAPVPPERAARQARSAHTAGLADDALRAQAGFVTSARRTREAEAVRRREFELADGHGEFRFSGYVGVAATTPEELATRCGEVEQAARATGLVLRRLYGRQAEARTWTLPLGRGVS